MGKCRAGGSTREGSLTQRGASSLRPVKGEYQIPGKGRQRVKRRAGQGAGRLAERPGTGEGRLD